MYELLLQMTNCPLSFSLSLSLLIRCLHPDCSGHGYCSKITGVCQCEEVSKLLLPRRGVGKEIYRLTTILTLFDPQGWSGTSCNETLIDSSFTSLTLSVSPSFLTSANSHLSAAGNSWDRTVSTLSTVSSDLSSKQMPLSSSGTQSMITWSYSVSTDCNTSSTTR